MKKTILAVLATLLLSSVCGFSQSKNTAELRGTVTDATGAVVPGAKVTATSTATSIARQANADGAGEYRILLLPPGTYDLKVEQTGFAGQTKKGVELTVGQTVVMDFQLAVGATTQMVEVTAEAPLVETERSYQAETIEQRDIRNLPINRRDYLTFALLAPGVADSKAMADANSFRVKQTPDSGISFYGSNGRGNNVTVDGGEANDAGGGVRPTVSQEAVQEFQINRSNYSAEYGSARGGVINIVTRAGANELHGSVFGFFRDQALDAGDPFAINKQLVRVKPPSTRQQFGGTLGGPIKKDRTFYYLAYEQLRRRESASVPLLTDLSIFKPTPAQETVLNTLPAPVAGALRAALTAPQSTVDLFLANTGIFPFQTDSYQGLVRLDHRINDRNQLNVRYNVTRSLETNQNVSAQVGVSRGFITDVIDSNALLGWTRSFSPRVINEARAQYSYYNPFTNTNDPFGPGFDINGFGFFNRNIFLPNDTYLRREEIIDNVSYSHGSHNWKFGTQVLIRNNNSSSATFFAGRFQFGTLPGSLLLAFNPSLAAALTPQQRVDVSNSSINGLQAFNLGLPQFYQQGFGDPVVAATYPLYGVFAQDTWKPKPNLTFNLGLRYEVDVRKSPLPTDKNNVAPRFGFAWDPWKDHKTIIRGGYGIYFAQIDYQIDYVANALNEINGFRQIAQIFTSFASAPPPARNGPVNIFQTLRAQGLIGIPTPTHTITPDDLKQFGIVVSQTGQRPPLTALFRNSADYQNPYSQQASFGIEREITPGFSLSASYIFSRGAKITRARDDNYLPAPVCPALGVRYWGSGVTQATLEGPRVICPSGAAFFKQPALLQDNVYESTANSFFHGLILEGRKRFNRNFSFFGNYTFSKSIDEVVDYNSDFQAFDQTNLRAERALSSFDQRHKVVLYGVFQTPHYGGGNAASRLFSDFVFTPIFRANSARPFNLLAGSDLNGDRHSTNDRPAFSGRNTGIGPGFWTFDTRLSRRIRLGENRSLELMAEAFNLFNHLNFASVNNFVCIDVPATACRAGSIGIRPRNDVGPSNPLGFTSAFDPRRFQLGLRLNF